MYFGGSDPARGRTPASDLNRNLAIETIKRQARDGLLSQREMDERIERVFRAKTLAELDLAMSDLSVPANVRADLIATHGIVPQVQAPSGWQSRSRRMLGFSLVNAALWVIIALVSHQPVWLIFAAVSSLMAVTRIVRLKSTYARQGRHITGRTRGRVL